eukprot:7705_1
MQILKAASPQMEASSLSLLVKWYGCKFRLLHKQKLLVHLDGGEDLSDEPEAHQSSHRSSNQEHCRADEEHVSKVQHVSDEHLRCLQTTEPEETVNEGVSSRASRCEEGEPPPPVILSTELVVAKEN